MSYVKRKFVYSRRYDTSLWGDPRDPFKDKNYPPGQHGTLGYSRSSGYGKQLRAKQLLRMHYAIREKQFRNAYKLAEQKAGDTAENFVEILETRLDSIVYRAKFAPTIFAAKQMIAHKHVLVNGRRVNIPSHRIKKDDIVQVRPESHNLLTVISGSQANHRAVPEYLKVDDEKKSVSISHMPALTEVPYPFVVDLNLIIAFYSK